MVNSRIIQLVDSDFLIRKDYAIFFPLNLNLTLTLTLPTIESVQLRNVQSTANHIYSDYLLQILNRTFRRVD